MQIINLGAWKALIDIANPIQKHKEVGNPNAAYLQRFKDRQDLLTDQAAFAD